MKTPTRHIPSTDATRVVALAIATWGALALGLATTGATIDPALRTSLFAILTGVAVGAYAIDRDLRAAARRASRATTLAWAFGFYAAAAGAAAFGHAGLACLFFLPVGIGFNVAALEGAGRGVSSAAPARSPARSPAAT